MAVRARACPRASCAGSRVGAGGCAMGVSVSIVCRAHFFVLREMNIFNGKKQSPSTQTTQISKKSI